jgi:hypothetical protein
MSASVKLCRVLAPASKELNRKFRMEAFLKIAHGEGSVEEYGDPSESEFFDEDADDDASVATQDVAQAAQIADHGGKHYDGWKPKYSIPINAVFVRQQHKKTLHILVSVQNVKQERDVLFDTFDDAREFCQFLDEQKQLEEKRQEGRLLAALGDIKLPKFETLTLLFEIVSGYDLPIGDFTSSDPFVVVMMGHQVVHKTDFVPKTYVSVPCHRCCCECI